jgi:hypothetical protein
MAVVFLLLATRSGRGEDVLFKDDFTPGLAKKWQAVGLKEADYRLRQGGVEMRVQPGELTEKTPMLKVILPFTSAERVTVSVKVSVLDKFTKDQEFAGVCLLDESGPEFAAKKERVDGKLVFAPGDYQFIGKPGQEGDPNKYKVNYTAETKEAGPLRIIVDRGYAYFQVGPAAKEEKYLNFFYSAIRKETKERGFCLIAAGAPAGATHWVRFEDFRVVRH